VLNETLAAKWIALAQKLGIATDALPKADGKTTRGEWLRKSWALQK